MKTVLVTGGAGFIGSHLCERLVGGGYKVLSLDNYFAGKKENHVAGVEYREGHTKDIAALIPETPDIIFHLGEYSRVEQSVLEPDVVHDLNVVGTAGVLEFWKSRGSKLVYAGSSTKFGDHGRTRETSPYAATKAANTERVKEQGDTFQLPYAITYFYNVYGPGERSGIYGTVIEAFKQMYLQGTPFTITAPGTQTRNFTHVDDIVDGLMLVGEKGHGDEYGLGNEKSFSILDVARLFKGDILLLPPRGSNRIQSTLDTSKSAALGWKPTRTLEKYIGDFVTSHPQGKKQEKRVLVFSTTFFPVAGPAEQALYELMQKVPDVQFDVVTASFTSREHAIGLPNVTVHRVGIGRPIDKYLLPLLGYNKARALHTQHSYLFSWALMASYGALSGVLFKRLAGVPLLVTLADQSLEGYSLFVRLLLKLILTNADQVYGIDEGQESHASNITKKALLRSSIGTGDTFANQLRYVYVDTLLRQNRYEKILIFSLAYYPRHVGGAEVAIKEITDRLPEIEFHMVCLGFDSSLPRVEKIGNVLVHRIGWGATRPTARALSSLRFRLLKLWFQFGAAWYGLQLYRKYKYDASWAMMAHSSGVPAALFKLFKSSTPYVLTLQEGDPIEHIEKTMLPLWPLFIRAFTSADKVQVISTYLGRWARRRGFKGTLEVIPNGVDAALFSKEVVPERIQEIRTELRKKEGDVFLVSTSRLVYKNAIDDILHALVLLPSHIKFLNIGTGSDDIKLKQLAKELGIADRVLFEPFKPQAELPGYLKACDIFIRPSRSEGMGNSFIEAFAAGLPVIATQEGGIADFLFDAKRNPDMPTTGWAVDVNSPGQIAAKVNEIVGNPEATAKVIENARTLAFEKYDWDLIAKEMREKVFNFLLKK